MSVVLVCWCVGCWCVGCWCVSVLVWCGVGVLCVCSVGVGVGDVWGEGVSVVLVRMGVGERG